MGLVIKRPIMLQEKYSSLNSDWKESRDGENTFVLWEMYMITVGKWGGKGAGGYKIRRVIVLLKWERLTVLILGNEDASTEGEAWRNRENWGSQKNRQDHKEEDRWWDDFHQTSHSWI